MDQTTLLFRFGVALFIGVLVGLQREFSVDDPSKEQALGVRTLPLFSLAGCAGALISAQLGSVWPLCCVILALAALLGVNYFTEASRGHVGLTTKAAAMVVVLAGALCYQGHLTLAVALGVAVTALLSAKIELHTFAHHLTREDIFATIKFAIITAIVLPVLPDRRFGPEPFTIFNPFKIWLFVVLISGISFVGYVLIKIIGARKGIGLMGVLGGLASSTAVTFSFTARSKENPELGRSFALSILVAWTVMYARVVVAVAVLNAGLARQLLLPLSVPVVVGLLYAAFLYTQERANDNRHGVAMSNPFELGLAIKFGVLFAVILFVSRAAQVYYGDLGIYISGFFSGLADVDAIALSMARLSTDLGGIPVGVAARAVIIATIANTIFKGGVALTGSSALRRAIGPGFALMVLGGVATLWLVNHAPAVPY